MPVAFHRPRDRRAFLKTAALSGAAMVVSGFRGEPRPTRPAASSTSRSSRTRTSPATAGPATAG